MTAKTKAIIKPEILVWARKSAGFSVFAASKKLHIDQEKLTAWEAGGDEKASPSIAQLRNIANLYKRPLAVFYLHQVPKDFQVIKDLRRLPGVGLRVQPPELVLEIRRVQQRRELVLDLLKDLGDAPKRFKLEASIKDKSEEVGNKIREYLGITQAEQMRLRDSRVSFNFWRERLENKGLLVFQTTSFNSEIASGFSIAEEVLPVIAINRKDEYSRRTFSMLHELAHIVLRISGISDLDSDDSRPPEDQKIEIYCNNVAAAALMPKEWLLADSRVVARGEKSTGWTDTEISDLAKIFGVSREALLRRLLNFGRTTDAFYALKRGQYIAEYKAQKERQKEKASETEMRRNMPREVMANLGQPLVRIVLGNYYQTNLTLSDVAGYLGVKTKHIENIEHMAGFR